jgi:hypothetical protein
VQEEEESNVGHISSTNSKMQDETIDKNFLATIPKMLRVKYEDKYYKLPSSFVANKLQFSIFEICTNDNQVRVQDIIYSFSINVIRSIL